MSEVAHNAERDFWRPPVVAPPVTMEPSAKSGMVEVCDGCETEFIAGSKFCHVCGARRTEQGTSHLLKNWMQLGLNWVRHLQFHQIERWIVGTRQRLGLPTAPLVAFLLGLVCIVGAVGVGVVFTVQTTLDWQAVQVWRIEWLLGASAAFLAGILLKKSAS